MIKTLFLLPLTIAAVTASGTDSAYADLGMTRAQIEAKYGEPDRDPVPVPVLGKDGKLHSVPIFWVDYSKDQINIEIHYSKTGMVTAVEYWAITPLWFDAQYVEGVLHANGLNADQRVKEFIAKTGCGDLWLDENHYLYLNWEDADHGTYWTGIDTGPAFLGAIEIGTTEAKADFEIQKQKVHEFYKAIGK